MAKTCTQLYKLKDTLHQKEKYLLYFTLEKDTPPWLEAHFF